MSRKTVIFGIFILLGVAFLSFQNLTLKKRLPQPRELKPVELTGPPEVLCLPSDVQVAILEFSASDAKQVAAIQVQGLPQVPTGVQSVRLPLEIGNCPFHATPNQIKFCFPEIPAYTSVTVWNQAGEKTTAYLIAENRCEKRPQIFPMSFGSN